jgi:hypothetical protein
MKPGPSCYAPVLRTVFAEGTGHALLEAGMNLGLHVEASVPINDGEARH